MCVTLVQMCPLYLTLFCLRACILWRGWWFLWVSLLLCVIALCGMFFIAPVLKLSCKKPWTRQVFLPGTDVFCERLFSALWRKLTRGAKLVSVLSWSHNKAYWIICTSDLAGEMRRFLFFSFFLCSTLQQPLSLFSYCIYWVWCWYEHIIMRHICVYL